MVRYVKNKTNQVNNLIELRCDLMNVDINYYDIINKVNAIYFTVGLEAEGERLSNTGTKKITYSDAIIMGSGKKN